MPNIVKNTTLPGLFDLLAPHSCRGCGRIGSPLCERCKNYIISAHASYQPDLPDHLPPTFVLGSRTGLAGTLVHDFKYHSVRALAHSLAELLDATLPEIRGRVVIVPLPTSTKHIRARALDHTLLIAKHLARLRGYHLERLLIRAKNTTQVGTSAAERQQQADAAYSINAHLIRTFQRRSPTPSNSKSPSSANSPLGPKTTYLLLDDVWTTGSSMQAALKKFRTLNPQKVQLVLLARN